MFPYYSIPFYYVNRNIHAMPQPIAPAAIPPVAPVPPAPTPVMPIPQPAIPNIPYQPSMIPTYPTAPIKTMPPSAPIAPYCPYMMGAPGVPSKPSVPEVSPAALLPGVPPMTPLPGVSPATSLPVAPTTIPAPVPVPTGNVTQPTIQPGVAHIEEMEDLDMGPSTAAASDPPPVLSNNPATANVILFKELTAYPNYGNPSGNADILYTGNRGTWTFEVPAFLFAQGNFSAQIAIRGVLDDHANVPVSQYSARITINGSVVHSGPLPLAHGVPVGGRFTNWRELTFNVPNLRRNNRIIIVNTSFAGANDWIGLDWMEMRFVSR